MNAYQEIANAIVAQAATDYRNALAGEGYRHMSPARAASDCERFFRSSYFSMLTKVSGEYIIEQIQKEARANETLD